MPSSILTSCLIFLISVFAVAAEKEDFFIYEAHSRPAEELQRAAQGIGNGTRITVMNQKLIIYGTRSQREQVLRLLQEIDHKLQNYVVSFRIAKAAASSAQRLEADGSLAGDGVRLSKRSGSAGFDGGVSAEWKGGASKLRLSGSSSVKDLKGNTETSLALGEGETAKIYSDSGLFSTNVIVTVRALGKAGARLEIRESDSDATGEQRLVTEINLPLGEWRTIGGVGELRSQSKRFTLGISRKKTGISKDVQVRVEPQQDP